MTLPQWMCALPFLEQELVPPRKLRSDFDLKQTCMSHFNNRPSSPSLGHKHTLCPSVSPWQEGHESGQVMNPPENACSARDIASARFSKEASTHAECGVASRMNVRLESVEMPRFSGGSFSRIKLMKCCRQKAWKWVRSWRLRHARRQSRHCLTRLAGFGKDTSFAENELHRKCNVREEPAGPPLSKTLCKTHTLICKRDQYAI